MCGVAVPEFHFITRPGRAESDANWTVPDAAQQAVVAHTAGPLLVRGGPGTGKTATLVEAVVARVAEGVPASQILVFGFGRRAAATLRRRISARLDRTGEEVPVYSFPSYAFGVLRRRAFERDQPPPRLLKGPEQDVVIRDLLASGAVSWPEWIHPALGTRAFVAQLRDLLLRATERGVDPDALAKLGRDHDRPEWVSAARFFAKYVDVMALSSLTGGAAYDSAEIVRAAAAELADDPRLPRPRHVFVDELQDTDPAQWELLRLIAGFGANLTAFGDPDSATYAFRGGDPRIMREFSDRFPTAEGRAAPVVELATCHRSAAAPSQAAANVAVRLRGPQRPRARTLPRFSGQGDASATVLRTATQQAGFIARQLREAHLRDGVAWSQMAVLAKSGARQLPEIARALRHAGAPARLDGADLALSAQPIVRHLLTIIQCGLDPQRLDEDTAVALLHSVYGGADAMLERRLRQELRRQAHAADVFRPAGELLVEVLREPIELAAMPDEAWAQPARRLAQLLQCARHASGSVEDVLWEVWDASGLGPRLESRALSTDSRAPGADADLDAMTTLFDWAAQFTDGLPGAGPEVFAAHVLEQTLPADTLAARAQLGDAVTLTTAHAAKGRQWDLVVVAGVQEGVWPDLRPRGSLLGAEYLVETDVSAAAADVDAMSLLLDQERRLFYVALTRARDRVLVTCVGEDDEAQPSRFLEELGVDVDMPDAPARPLTLAALTAELRVAACGEPGPRRDAAVAQLARLAREGVPGADPDDWWGLRPLSDDRPLALPGEKARISPSDVESMDQCGLRWMLERHGGNEPSSLAQQVGNLIHAAAETVAEHPDQDAETLMREFVDRHAENLPYEAPWRKRQQHAELQEMTTNYVQWLRGNDRELVAVERRFEVRLPQDPPGVELTLRGVVDRLERDSAGGLHVVDVKTGKVPTSNKDIDMHPQLAAYQMAVRHGAFGQDATAAGASLVYPRLSHRQTGSTLRVQEPLGRGSPAEDKVRQAAQDMTKSAFRAVHSDKCRTCAVKLCCPISGKGTAVTQ